MSLSDGKRKNSSLQQICDAIDDNDPELLELYDWTLKFKAEEDDRSYLEENDNLLWQKSLLQHCRSYNGLGLKKGDRQPADAKPGMSKHVSSDTAKRSRICKQYFEDRYSFISLFNQVSRETYNPLEIARIKESLLYGHAVYRTPTHSAPSKSAKTSRWCVSNEDICEYYLFVLDGGDLPALGKVNLRQPRVGWYHISEGQTPVRNRGLRLAVDRVTKKINLFKGLLRDKAHYHRLNYGLQGGIIGGLLRKAGEGAYLVPQPGYNRAASTAASIQSESAILSPCRPRDTSLVEPGLSMATKTVGLDHSGIFGIPNQYTASPQVNEGLAHSHRHTLTNTEVGTSQDLAEVQHRTDKPTLPEKGFTAASTAHTTAEAKNCDIQSLTETSISYPPLPEDRTVNATDFSNQNRQPQIDSGDGHNPDRYDSSRYISDRSEVSSNLPALPVLKDLDGEVAATRSSRK